MNDLPGLSPEENEALRQMLHTHQAQDAPIQFVEKMPLVGSYIGKVGRYVVYAAIRMTKIVAILLIPFNVERAYNYFEPKAEAVYAQLSEAYLSLQNEQSAIVETQQPENYAVIRSPWKDSLPPATGANTLTIVSTIGLSNDDLIRDFRQVQSPSGLI